MTKQIKFLEDCIFKRDLIYKKDKLYVIKQEDNTHYIVPDELGNENELSKDYWHSYVDGNETHVLAIVDLEAMDWKATLRAIEECEVK